MDRIQEIKECTQKLIQNRTAESRWNDKMLVPMAFEEWKDFLLDRSCAIRAFYSENEELIGKLRGYYASPFDSDTAEALFQSARTMMLEGRLDPALICEICEPLFCYFVRTDNIERAVTISMLLCTSSQDYYNRMIPDYRMDKLEEFLQWNISQSKNYCSFSDFHTRQNILYSYFNLIMMYLQISEEDAVIEKAFGYFNQLNQLWKDPKVQALDGSDAQTCGIIDMINCIVPMNLYISPSLNRSTAKKILHLLSEYCDSLRETAAWDMKELIRVIEIRQKEYRKEITVPDAIHEITHIAEHLPDVDWKNNVPLSQEVFQLFGHIFLSVMRLLEQVDLPAAEKEQRTMPLLKKFHAIIENLPYEYLTSYVSDVCKNTFYAALPNLATMELKEKLLHELLIHRQPSTYLHSQMVEQISLIIAEEMLAKKPELFLTLPGYSNPEQISAKRDELLQFIARGARLHDVGKCSIAAVIMQQSRKLTEDEFICIKTHPKLGNDLFQKDPDFSVYSDIILGHHKTYDGQKGYPADFDNTASPYRILIDLISISDSTDAATDITGRNYTPGKDFLHLLEELKEGAGTRYNPDIVQLIADSPTVISRLSELTSTGRISYCYEAYQKNLRFN